MRVASVTGIRLRPLTHYLERGGALTEARLIEDEEGVWTMRVRLADRPGEYRVNQFHDDSAKTYKNLALAYANLREDFRYFGPITLSTERRQPDKG